MPGQLVLLCGRSFSGKSVLARGLAEALPRTVVSLDAINGERDLDGGEPPGEDEEPVRVVTEELSMPQMVAAVSDAISRPSR